MRPGGGFYLAIIKRLSAISTAFIIVFQFTVVGLQGYARAVPKSLIAHRGASAHAPENTLSAYRLAIAQGADFVEQDLQITKDGVLVCLHDLTLERTTNVEDVFPNRFKEGKAGTAGTRRWYVSDFTLQEIKQLDAGAWFDPKFKGERIPSWQEAIDMIRGKAGLYPETKAPEVYGRLGFDMESLVIEQLRKNKLEKPGADPRTPVIIQSFSDSSLRKMHDELKVKLPLVFLLSGEGRAAWLSPEGMAKIRQFATGIGPVKNLVDAALVKMAHDAGLTVTAYTFRISDKGAQYKTVGEEMGYYLYSLGIDALFTDNPDQFPRKP
jgi:glycerophosphoryl diester phosphodiesterase